MGCIRRNNNMTNPYTLDLASMCWKPETANRTNAHGLDAANEAADTYYTWPIPIKRPPVARVIRNRVTEFVGGYADYALLYQGDYPPLELDFVGPLADMNMFVQMLYGGTTTPNTPSAGLYQRQYLSTTLRTTPCPTFQFLTRFVNPTSAQTMYVLSIGAVVKKFKINAVFGQPVELSLTIAISKSIAGVALNTYPAVSKEKAFFLGDSTITYTKGGSALAGLVFAFTIDVDNKAIARQAGKWCYDWIPGFREIKCTLEFSMETKAEIEGSDTYTAKNNDDLDCTIKLARSATDYVEFAFEKLWDSMNNAPSFDWLEFLLAQSQPLIIKPTWYETGGKMTVTEVNSEATPS